MKLGLHLYKGNDNVAYSKWLSGANGGTPIPEGRVVKRASDDSVAIYDTAGEPAFGVAGHCGTVPKGVGVTHGICGVQTATGIAASGLLGKEAFVAADGRVTDNNTTGVAIGTFEEDANHADGEVTIGEATPRNDVPCIKVKVLL